jgi:ABC-type polysaccharide/polyol phosphate transport system ATPase subunit
MSEPKIVFDSVWKKFARGERHDSLRDLLPSMMRRMSGRGRVAGELDAREFWSVRDVSFTVDRGQALGIIGPNGAGKSTTLKLLTRILRADRGRIHVQGRIGALIEVAAGFHPDLTGRENVYLQGAIMGMPKVDIARKFDEIVEFAGVAPFIDTPVKRYSSGMNARLGFAIAAHLEPDVLIIDEVLSVGDFSFQNRAFNKISDLVRRETPVVVVSHQLDQIAALCTHAVLLDRGQVAEAGSPQECIRRYLTRGAQASDGTEPVRFHSMTIEPRGPYVAGQRITVHLTGETRSHWKKASEYISLRLMTHTGQQIFTTGMDRLHLDIQPDAPFEIEISLDLNLAGGAYMLDALVWEYQEQRQVVGGPVVLLQVEEDLAQAGQVYLNPHGRLATPSARSTAPTV